MTNPNVNDGAYPDLTGSIHRMKQVQLVHNSGGGRDDSHKENHRENHHPGATAFHQGHQQQQVRVKRERGTEASLGQTSATMNDLLGVPIPKRARLSNNNNNNNNNTATEVFGGVVIPRDPFAGMPSPALGNHQQPSQLHEPLQPNMMLRQLADAPGGHSFSAIHDDDNNNRLFLQQKIAAKQAEVQADATAFWEARLEEQALDEKGKALKTKRSELKERLKTVRAELEATSTARTQASEQSSALEMKKNTSQREYDALVARIVGGPNNFFANSLAANVDESTSNASVSVTKRTVPVRSTAPSRRSSDVHAHSAPRRQTKMNRDTLIQLALDAETVEDAKATLIEYVTNTSIADLRRALRLPTITHVRGISAIVSRNLVRVLSRGCVHLQPEFRRRLDDDAALKRLLVPARGGNLMIKNKQEDLHISLIECLELA